jgi:hypothetical protein
VKLAIKYCSAKHRRLLGREVMYSCVEVLQPQVGMLFNWLKQLVLVWQQQVHKETSVCWKNSVSTSVVFYSFHLSLDITGYKLVQESDGVKDDPQQLFVIDYNSKNFGEVLQGNNRNRIS